MKLFLLLSLMTVLTVKATPRHHPLAAKPTSPLLEDQRIVGGHEIKTPVPFMAEMWRDGRHNCGGAIINARTILTAAHCFDNVDKYNLVEYHVGENTKTLKHGKVYKAEIIIKHPEYNADTIDNDAAIVRLNETLIFNERVQPISLIEEDTVLEDGSTTTVYGWGRIKHGGKQSEILKFAEFPLIDRELCKRLMRGKPKLTNNMLCAGNVAGGTDACQGDSGGPLVQNDRLIGIVSWGHNCALPDKVGVYTDVKRMLPWIKETLYQKFGERL